jgi:hypothetical protein
MPTDRPQYSIGCSCWLERRIVALLREMAATAALVAVVIAVVVAVVVAVEIKESC